MPRFLTRTLLFLFATVAMLAAPRREAAAEWGAAKVVTIAARFDSAETSGTVKLILTATVDPKYHLYAINQPAGSIGPTPTKITLDESTAAVLIPTAEWTEPKPTITFDKGFEHDIAILAGSPLVFSRAFSIKPGTPPGDFTATGNLLYQACTETSCLPPKEVAFTATVKILPGAGSAVTIKATLAPTPTPAKTSASLIKSSDSTPSGPQKIVGATQRAIAEKSFGGFLLYAFLFGLAALATPCVFPMIPITVTFFTKKSGSSRIAAARLALIYVISIIAGFSLVGFGISMILLFAGSGISNAGFANVIAANPFVNLFFALLYFVFALSLFELFEIRLPESLANRLNQSAVGRSDWMGVAMKALVFVVISFTCTAPLVGALIVQTLSGGSWTRPLFGMMAFATGFASPFFILALVPQYMASLPKAGAWMYSTKIVMGIVVIAAAFKFLSNADLVWNKSGMILTREMLLAVWAALALVVAFYLYRFIRLPQDGDLKGIGYGRLLLGTTSLSMGLYLAAGLFGSHLHPWLEAYLPPDLSRSESSLVASASAPVSAVAGQEISAGFSWYRDIDSGIAAARAQGKNIFIDFTGYTCTNCRLMEKNMFPKPEVAALLNQYVRVQLITDDRETGEKWQEYQASKFGTVALPFYAIITPDGKTLATEEFTRDEKQYVAFLQTGLEKEVAKAEK